MNTPLECAYCSGIHWSGAEKTDCWKRTKPFRDEQQSPIRDKAARSKSGGMARNLIVAPSEPNLTPKEKLLAAENRRQNPTRAEALLERSLKRLVRKGYEFKREFEVSGYFADFCLPRAKLIIELDGPIHMAQVHHDARRDGLLSAQGFTTLRFSNYEVLNQPTQLVTKIEKWLKQNSIPPIKAFTTSDRHDSKGRSLGELFVNSDLTVSETPKKKTGSVNKNRLSKARFICLHCKERGLFIAPFGHPKCYGCQRNDGTRVVCRSCSTPFVIQSNNPSQVCNDCREIRQISREAARGVRADITALRESSGGRIFKGDL